MKNIVDWKSQKFLKDPKDAPRRALFKCVGYTESDLRRPLIGVANTWSELGPCHYDLNRVAAAVKAGIWQAGGTPLEFVTPSLCPTMGALGHHGMRYHTPTREITANAVEAIAGMHFFDAMVSISTHYTIMAGQLLAAARLDIPTIIVPGGPMLPGKYKGKEFLLADLDELSWGAYNVGKVEAKELYQLENVVCPGPGACPVMGTANTLQGLTEAVGMTLPYAATAPAGSSRRLCIAKESGRQIMKLLQKGIRPSAIMTKDGLENMIRVHMALGGSTKVVYHILALVEELGLGGAINIDTFDRFSQGTPCLTPVRPCGPYNVIDLDEAGGIPAVMKEISPLLHKNALTITGKTIEENLRNVKVLRREVVRPFSDPVYKEGGVAVLRGNLAKTSITRTIAIKKELWYYKGEAKAFDSMEDAMKAVTNGNVVHGDVIVIRYEGPRGGPGLTEIFPVIGALSGMGLDVAVVTDGKISGFARGLGVSLVTPEAMVGGPLAVVRNGDIIEIDVVNKLLNLKISDEELDKRMRKWKAPKPRVKRGVLALFAQMAEPADKGAGINLRMSGAGIKKL